MAPPWQFERLPVEPGRAFDVLDHIDRRWQRSPGAVHDFALGAPSIQRGTSDSQSICSQRMR